MINYKVIDGFIDESVADHLVRELHDFSDKPETRFQGGRRIMPNTAENFRNLLKYSEAWRDLDNRLTSSQFVQNVFEELNVDSQKYRRVNFFSRCGKTFEALTRYASRPLRNNNPAIVFLWSVYSVAVLSSSKITAKILSFFGMALGELLYDVSSAGNGYSREIHRDSDARVFVFLLYLNDPNVGKNATGGELLLHTHSDEYLIDPPPQPDPSETTILEEVAPKSGRLVVFENNRKSYHSVRKMSGFKDERFFCYGSFTLLSGRNACFDKSKHYLRTDFKMYL